MERRLLRAIINPAMTVAWLAGLYLAWAGHWYLYHYLYWRWRLVEFAGQRGECSDRPGVVGEGVEPDVLAGDVEDHDVGVR